MSVDEVQSLIDSLAARLGRPVGVDDRRFRAIAYSSHEDEIDEVRKISILARRPPDAVAQWLEEVGLPRARGMIRVPANPELRMVERVCFPVRFHDRLLGYLWLVELDGSLSDEELDLCARCATELAEALYRLRQQTSEERRLEAEWVEAVLNGDDPADTSVSIAADSAYVVMVMQVTFSGGKVAPDGVDVRITKAVDQLRRSVPPRHQLAAVDELGATVVLAASDARDVDRHAASLLTAAETELSDIEATRVILGVGDPTDSVEALPRSAAEARAAVRLGKSMPDLGPLVQWGDLGVIRLLGELVGDRHPGELLPPPIRRLVADPDGEPLLLALETYLEHAGDVAGAAAELFLHRSSLYNRLHRVEEVTGVNLRSGADRLELHLGVRLWRMSGAATGRPDGKREA